GVMAGCVPDDLRLPPGRVHVHGVVAGVFDRRPVYHDALEDVVPAEDQVDDLGEVEDPDAGIVGGGDQLGGGVRRVHDEHPLALLDPLRGDLQLVENLVGGGADGGLVHEIPAGPEPPAEL